MACLHPKSIMLCRTWFGAVAHTTRFVRDGGLIVIELGSVRQALATSPRGPCLGLWQAFEA